MTNKLVVIINSLNVPKIKKILLYEMEFLVPNYSCLQNPWLGGYRPQIAVLSVLSPQLNLLNLPEQNSWVRHCSLLHPRTSQERLTFLFWHPRWSQEIYLAFPFWHLCISHECFSILSCTHAFRKKDLVFPFWHPRWSQERFNNPLLTSVLFVLDIRYVLWHFLWFFFSIFRNRPNYWLRLGCDRLFPQFLEFTARHYYLPFYVIIMNWCKESLSK